jgi:hypothetical protein
VTADQLEQAVGESGLFRSGVKAAARAVKLCVRFAETTRVSLGREKLSFLWLGDSIAAWTPFEQLTGSAEGRPPPPSLRARLLSARRLAGVIAAACATVGAAASAAVHEAEQPPPPPGVAAEQAKADRAAGYAALAARRATLASPADAADDDSKALTARCAAASIPPAPYEFGRVGAFWPVLSG